MAEPPPAHSVFVFSAPECYRQSKMKMKCPWHGWSIPAGHLPTTHGEGPPDLLLELLIAHMETLVIIAHGQG